MINQKTVAHYAGRLKHQNGKYYHLYYHEDEDQGEFPTILPPHVSKAEIAAVTPRDRNARQIRLHSELKETKEKLRERIKEQADKAAARDARSGSELSSPGTSNAPSFPYSESQLETAFHIAASRCVPKLWNAKTYEQQLAARNVELLKLPGASVKTYTPSSENTSKVHVATAQQPQVRPALSREEQDKKLEEKNMKLSALIAKRKAANIAAFNAAQGSASKKLKTSTASPPSVSGPSTLLTSPDNTSVLSLDNGASLEPSANPSTPVDAPGPWFQPHERVQDD